MAYVSVPNSFTDGTSAQSSKVNDNFSAVVTGLSDETKDINVAAGTFAGLVTCGSNVELDGSNLAKTSAPVADTIYPNSMVKAWAYLTCGAAGAVTVTEGFNIDTATYATSVMAVNFHTSMSDGNYFAAVEFSDASAPYARRAYVSSTSTGTVEVTKLTIAATPSVISYATNDKVVLTVIGAQ